jgi:predicted transcriptional regulator of viral defense system
MKHYETLLKMGCFTWEELCVTLENPRTASKMIQSYLKKGYIQNVKRGLYVAVNLTNNEPVVSKFHIAGRITASAYVSHHAAFEFYGYANQVSYNVEVSSETRFNTFEFNGNTYSYLTSRIPAGITTVNDIRITDKERTVLDGINDFEKVMGLEELLRCIDMVSVLNEDKLLSYLAVFDKQALYQKTGYILEHYKDSLGLSTHFFKQCEGKIGKSKRYFNKSGKVGQKYNARWRLVVPDNLTAITQKGVFEVDVEI